VPRKSIKRALKFNLFIAKVVLNQVKRGKNTRVGEYVRVRAKSNGVGDCRSEIR